MNFKFKCGHENCFFGNDALYPGPDDSHPFLCKIHATEAWQEWKQKETALFYEKHPERKPVVVRGDPEEKKWKEKQKDKKEEKVTQDGLKKGALSPLIDKYLYKGGTIKDIAQKVAEELGIKRDLTTNVNVRFYMFRKKGFKVEKNSDNYVKVINK